MYILQYILRIRRKRPNLKIIVSSATLDADSIAKFFEDEKYNFKSNIVYVEGRQYPVDIYYLKNSCQNYVTKSVELSLDIHQNKPDGDILIFLTGQEEIETFIEMLNQFAKSISLLTSFNKSYICICSYQNHQKNTMLPIIWNLINGCANGCF